MANFFRIFLTLGILSGVLFSETGFAKTKKAQKKTGSPSTTATASNDTRTTSSHTTTAQSSTTTTHHHRSLPMEGTAALSLLAGGGAAAPGFNLELGIKIISDDPLYIGGDLGFYFNTSPFVLFVAPLPAAYLKFEASPKVTPKIGIALGPVIASGGGYSSVSLGLLFKPAVDIKVSPSWTLNVETRLGVMFSSFVFLPQVGATFNI